LSDPPYAPAQDATAANGPAAIEVSPESLAAWNVQLSTSDAKLLDEIQRGCFNYFWNEVGEPAMLAKDKTSDTICSVAAVGFQLSSLPIGVERGWISRGEGEKRAITVLKALTQRRDNKKNGIYLHYVDERHGGHPDFSRTKHRYELVTSTVDHSLLLAGAITAASYFGGETAKLTDEMINAADWRSLYDDKAGYLYMGWKATTDRGVDGPGEFTPNHWEWCSDEERLIYFLAAGAPDESKAIDPAAYYRLKRIVKRHQDLPPYVVSWNGSLFTYFFAHCWIDYRHLAVDDPTALGVEGPRVDWFENSRRASLTQRQRCIEAASKYPTLAGSRWGVAPCGFRDRYLVHDVRPNISDNENWLNGVVPPYAAGSAIMFTPAESLDALREYKLLTTPDGKPLVWRDPATGGYSFVDSFSLTPPYGHDENFGIDAGPMLLAIENVRTGLVWRLFMEHYVAKRSAERLKLAPRE
jgi:hypothetical protein